MNTKEMLKHKTLNYFYNTFMFSLYKVKKRKKYINVIEIQKEIILTLEKYISKNEKKVKKEIKNIIIDFYTKKKSNLTHFNNSDLNEIIYKKFSNHYLVNIFIIIIFNFFPKINFKNINFWRKFLDKGEKNVSIKQ